MATISVIVPVYNAHTTLCRCISSILNQTYLDFELILIDDGSTDNSFDICQSYANQDSRVKCFTQQNSGVSSARNKGLDEASGQYVCFVDADDEIEANYLTDLMLQIPDKASSYFILQGWIRVPSMPDKIIIERFPDAYIEKSDFILLFSKYRLARYGYPFSKMYIRQILEQHHIRFHKEIVFSEDLVFMLDYLACVDLVIISHKTNYLYYETEGSLTKRIFNEEVERHGLDRFLESIDRLAEKQDLDRAAILRLSAFSLHTFMYRILLSIYLYPSGNRLSSLKNFYNDYGKYSECDSKGSLMCIIMGLLSHKYYVYSDMLMRLYVFIKRAKRTVFNK